MRLLEAIIAANHAATEGRRGEAEFQCYADCLPLAALTCIDPRLNKLFPGALGLSDEQFIWLRNAGNVITSPTSSTVRSIAMSVFLKGAREIAVIGHTDCRMTKINVTELLDRLHGHGISRGALPIPNLHEFFGLFSSEKPNVIKAVGYLRTSPVIPPKMPVHGLIIDSATGRLEWVINGYESSGLPLDTAGATEELASLNTPLPVHGYTTGPVKSLAADLPPVTSAPPKPAPEKLPPRRSPADRQAARRTQPGPTAPPPRLTIVFPTMPPNSKPFILCVGLTPNLQAVWRFPRVVEGGVNRALSVTTAASGKGVNVAHVLRALGARPLLLGFLGGPTGDLARQDLARWDVQEECLRVAARTRVCQSLLDQATGRVTELVEEASLPTRPEWRALFARYTARLPRAEMIVIAGALMPGAPVTTYQKLAKLAGTHGIPLIIDSQREPLRRLLPLRPFLAKLNVHELAMTLGTRVRGEPAAIRAARRLIAAGAQQVLVTAGASGAWLVGPERACHFQPPRIEAVNPIGSGDAVTAGIAYGLGKKQSLPDAIRLGIACGAANALTLMPGHVDRRIVYRLLRQVKLNLPLIHGLSQ